MERVNNRGFKETVFEQKHLSLEDLKRNSLKNRYIWKNVPLVPIPVEFHVPKVTHVTDKKGLRKIIGNGGFRVEPDRLLRAGEGSGFLWWGLSISKSNITETECWFLKERFPDRTRAEASRQEPFLHRLATSTAFQEGSRFGNFKFSFQLSDLLHEYSRQFCRGRKPTLRVFETVVYKQEILYSVVVHDPDDCSFDEYPPLEDRSDGICALRGYHFIWRAQAISNPCKVSVAKDDCDDIMYVEEMPNEEYYVWQNAALAFHLPVGVTFQFAKDLLLRRLSACFHLVPKLSRAPWMKLKDAQKLVEDFKSQQ